MSLRHGSAVVGLLAVLSVPGCRTVPIEHEPWVEVRTDTFRLVSQVDRERSVAMARSLERFQSVVKLVANQRSFEPRVPTTILLLRGPSYRQLGPTDTAGAFVPGQRANYALVDASGRQREATGVLLHEYTHHLVNNDPVFTYPGWYNEGLAELMRGTVEREQSIVVGGMLRDRRVTLDELRSYPLRRLLREPPSGHSPVTTSLYYAKAWHLVQYLTYGSRLGDRTRQLVDYLVRVHEGTEPEQACQEAFGVSIDELDWELERYLRKGRLGTLVLRRSAIPEPSEPVVRSLGADEVAGELGAAALMLRDGARAESFFRSLRALRPDSARAHFGLAHALRLQARRGEYEPLYERGLELGPDEALGLLDYGAYLLGRAAELAGNAAAAEPRRELVVRARAHLRRATELAPELPEAHARLATSYLSIAGEEDVEKGLASVERAHELLASDLEINYLLALGHFRANRLDEASRLVRLARLRAHGEAPAVEKLAAQIEAARAGVPAPEPGAGATP